MSSLSDLVVRQMQEKEDHVARVSARMKELRAQGLTQAADEKQETLMVLLRALATDRERWSPPEGKGSEAPAQPVGLRV